MLSQEHEVLFWAGMNRIWAIPVTGKRLADIDLVRYCVHLSGSEESVVGSKTDPQTVLPVRNSPWLSKGSALALQSAMSLISMTSPRNFQLHSALAPSFVEFDMSMEGYGYCCCCFYFSCSGDSKSLLWTKKLFASLLVLIYVPYGCLPCSNVANIFSYCVTADSLLSALLPWFCNTRNHWWSSGMILFLMNGCLLAFVGVYTSLPWPLSWDPVQTSLSQEGLAWVVSTLTHLQLGGSIDFSAPMKTFNRCKK